jgi:Putative auto-transporter adhesin, head GIN domain
MTTYVKQSLFGLMALGLFLTSCDPSPLRGKGDLVYETRDVEDFEAIDLECNADVEVRIDSFFKVEVTCEESIIGYLETNESNGVLKIYFSRNVFGVDDLKIKITMPRLNACEVDGSGDIQVLDLVEETKLEIDVSGSGNADFLKLDCEDIDVRISGSGEVELNGTAEFLEASISGSGNLDALYCPVERAKINVSGSGDVVLDVSDLLEVDISGSGTVRYKGDPNLDSDISGSGSVKKI